MRQKLAVALLASLVVLVGAALSSTAFTAGAVDRQANVDVVADQNGPLALADGNTGNVVTQKSNGELAIDFTNPSGSSGVNPNATYQLGDPGAASSTYAFTVTNTDSQSHETTFSYALGGTDPDGTVENVNFSVYDDTGAQLTTAAEGATGTTTLASGQTAYVVVEVDTTNLGQSDDLSGTLSIAAN
jgi:hypothetical protein